MDEKITDCLKEIRSILVDMAEAGWRESPSGSDGERIFHQLMSRALELDVPGE